MQALGANLEDKRGTVGAAYALYLALAYFPIRGASVQVCTAFEGVAGRALLGILVMILEQDEIKEQLFVR